MQNKVVHVFYHGRKVGRVALADARTAAFEYDGEWLADGFSISPFSMPLAKKVFLAPREPFDGNFGVFNDSIPDGWGRLLIDRLLRKNGVNPAEVSLLDRLALVGTSGMGALEYQPAEALNADFATNDLNVLAKEAAAILHDRPYTGQALADLVKLGGSSGGARPKVLLTIDGEEWLVKFRAAVDPKNIGKKEYQYALLARKAGLDFPAARLFEGKYFGARRFDRCAGEKVFMLSASALLDASHRYPTLDYVDLLNAALKLTRDFGEAEKLFRQMCFNVFYHNRDDHAKNFSFLYTGKRWTVSPPYDLVYAEGMGGEHATTIDGAGKAPTADDIMRVAAKTGIKNARKIMEEVGKAGDSIATGAGIF